jgi:hypothetical protein
VLDIPNGVLDPQGFTKVDVVLHGPTDFSRSTTVANGVFDLGVVDPGLSVSVEATLRNDSGAAVGYGRTPTAMPLAGGSEVVVPVRRPIAYIAGPVSRGIRTVTWSEAPATYSDLSVGATLDGRTVIGTQVVLMLAAGPNLYLVTQGISSTTGALTGSARITPVSTANHALGTMLQGSMSGAVLDGAGADDGSTLVIGTDQQLFAIDTEAGTARSLASGNFSRVAVLTSETGEIDAVAIKNRGPTTGPCQTSAELWWAPLSGDGAAHMVATGGFSDIATDRGHAYYIDGCKSELGELTEASAQPLRTIAVPTGGEPTALAVSNGQAYIGVESPSATTTLLVAAIAMTAPPRTLWKEAAQQVVRATNLTGVLRQLDATSAQFAHLEVGAGGDYVALTTAAHFHGNAVPAANFPEMTIDTEELRVFDAATGGSVQRYRSWCAGVVIPDPLATGEILDWSCASAAGQTAAASGFEHHIRSMAFQFGKR